VPYFLHYYREGMPFAEYLDVIVQQERGENLPAGYVPTTFLFAFVGTRIVGRVSIRHTLNDFLELAGGHIGYVVVPEFRRRGYGTTILRRSVEIATQKLGLDRVLVICDVDNIGSIRAIEQNGGVLENVVTVQGFEKPMRRYWIEPATLSSGGAENRG
jgi:predicted acetyltransferase